MYHLPSIIGQGRYAGELMMPCFLRVADQIICVSEQSKRDAERLYGISPAKMTVIYEAVDARYQPATDRVRLAEVRQRYDLSERFILHVGTIEPRKKGWLYEPFFEKQAQSGLASEVIFPGFVAGRSRLTRHLPTGHPLCLPQRLRRLRAAPLRSPVGRLLLPATSAACPKSLAMRACSSPLAKKVSIEIGLSDINSPEREGLGGFFLEMIAIP